MPIDTATIDSLSDSFAFVVDTDGTCVLNPRAPDKVGTKPWDWCVDEDRQRCREEFIQACMFRQPREPFEVRVAYHGDTLRLSMRLFPLETGQVLGLFHRLFDGELTSRERHVLVLLAGGATAEQVGAALGITASTARDHVARIKRKLHIRSPDGFRVAAHQFGLAGAPRPK